MSTKTIVGATAILALGIGAYFACDAEDGLEAASELEVSIRPKADFPLRDNPSSRPTQILVAVGGISAHHVEDGWLDDVWQTAAFDLLAPEQAIPTILGAAPLPEGRYDQLRFDIVYAGVEIDRKWYPLDIPSEDQSGLKVHTSFCLVHGETTSLELDWDVDEALHYSEERGYWLEPSLSTDSVPTCADDKRGTPRS